MHINLFVVITVRIILVITVDKIMRNNFSQLLEMNELYGNLNIKAVSKLRLNLPTVRILTLRPATVPNTFFSELYWCN